MDDDDALPMPTVKGPDENGIKIVIEYYRTDSGDALKKFTKYKVTTVEKKVYKVSHDRRRWPRFGAARQETAQDSVSVQAAEELPFERVRPVNANKAPDKKVTDMQSLLATSDKSAVVGSLTDELRKRRMERELLRAKGLLKEAEKPPEDDKPGGGLSSAPKPGSYVPPSKRLGAGGGGEGESMQRRREENSVRVTNLSEDVSEADLQELFRPIGPIQRIFLAVNKDTGESRGFAFVNYTRREDAERAIRVLNGYGYDNLILRVEWAAPREQKP